MPTLTTPAPLSLTSLVLNLLIGAVISIVLSWHFQRFGRTMSNRKTLGQVFPLIVLTTIVVISVIKSSLALSLGLVGALSIVRFRTPIKVPEELAYLFFAIGMGLGLGADHRVVVVVASTLILGALAGRGWLAPAGRDHNLFLNIEVPQGARGTRLEDVIEVLTEDTQMIDARRIDVRDGLMQATFLVHFQDHRQLVTVWNTLQERFPTASITFVDQNNSIVG